MLILGSSKNFRKFCSRFSIFVLFFWINKFIEPFLLICKLYQCNIWQVGQHSWKVWEIVEFHGQKISIWISLKNIFYIHFSGNSWKNFLYKRNLPWIPCYFYYTLIWLVNQESAHNFFHGQEKLWNSKLICKLTSNHVTEGYLKGIIVFPCEFLCSFYAWFFFGNELVLGKSQYYIILLWSL